MSKSVILFAPKPGLKRKMSGLLPPVRMSAGPPISTSGPLPPSTMSCPVDPFVPIRAVVGTTEVNGKKVPQLRYARYSRAEADRLFNVSSEEEYGKLGVAGILGGGAEWDEAVAEVSDEI